MEDELILSNLQKTWIFDLDGTLDIHEDDVVSEMESNSWETLARIWKRCCDYIV